MSFVEDVLLMMQMMVVVVVKASMIALNSTVSLHVGDSTDEDEPSEVLRLLPRAPHVLTNIRHIGILTRRPGDETP